MLGCERCEHALGTLRDRNRNNQGNNGLGYVSTFLTCLPSRCPLRHPHKPNISLPRMLQAPGLSGILSYTASPPRQMRNGAPEHHPNASTLPLDIDASTLDTLALTLDPNVSQRGSKPPPPLARPEFSTSTLSPSRYGLGPVTLTFAPTPTLLHFALAPIANLRGSQWRQRTTISRPALDRPSCMPRLR